MYCFIYFSHWDPNHTSVVKVVDEDFERAKVLSKQFDLDYQYVKVPINCSLVYFEHSDEAGGSVALPFNDIKALERKLEQELKVGDTESKDSDWLEIETSIGTYSRDLSKHPWKDAVDARNDIINRIKNSFIDGDSSSAECVISIKTGKPEWCGEIDISFYEDFDEYFEQFEPNWKDGE